ncbi:histone-lysine N-methyltransferase 2C isoform X8 [Syngnathus scovelli]|uniref:histone-lysine N-methyltransferase 2C isoform X8 n=1 Tax=Syngnathus scovelli TaxID=161590 RepID=UPI00210F3F82|nr:histone-lysine N-methyltransferase 2C isoform X9 [Syngnathus scovelli]
MPSEDRRAPPPVTRAGRKAAESARRPRGRPRKDGVGGRAVPPPAPPPPAKSRKKGRSRGQAQVEDEEGVDTTEKRQMAEVTTGRRGSASRRRSNTEPTLAVPEAPPCEPPVPLTPPLTSITEEEPSQNGAIAPPLPPDSPGGEMSRASLASSPAPSPPLRLEDDDALSPLLRCSVSEDSGSPTPSLGHTEKRLQQCAFCYRGEHPPLGQGPLVVFGPTPGYIPLHVLSRRTSSDRDGDCHDHCYPCGQAVHTNSSSPAQCDDESSMQLLEQLGAVGLPHDIDVQSLFDPTGQCCAHLQCAAWSEGVCRGEGQALLYVDKAIDSGSAQVCAFCGGLGASLRCRETGCGQSYHFPCAAAAGAHQDWEQRRTLCTRHTHAESRSCVLCSRGGDVGALLMCCCCGNQYHAKCLAPPLNASSLIRAGWQCASCRVCQRCRLRDETSVLLVCARCDKAYHPHCLTPPLDHTPDSKWTCQNCRVCRRCGVRSSGRWANHPFLCVSCDPALPCGVCGHTPDFSSLQDCVTCVHCYRCVHTQCVSVETGVSATKCDSYVCSACQRAEPAAIPIILPSTDVQSPTIPTSTTAHSPVQFSSSTQAQTPTDIARLSQENPVPSPSDATEPSSPSSPTEQRLCLVLSPSDPAELQQSPTSSPSSNEQRLSLVLSPSDPSELQQSPTSSPSSPTELQESPQSSPSHATKPEQKSPEHTELRLRLVLSPSNPAEFQQSPGSSSSSSSSKPKELRLSPPQSPSNPTDLHPSPEQSPSNATVQRSPPSSPANFSVLPQYPTPSSWTHAELDQSPSFSSETQTTLATSPFNPNQHSPPQSPSEGMALQTLNYHQAELQLSPVLSLSDTTEVPKSRVPSPSNVTDPQQSPMPSPSNTTTLFLSPTPSPSMVAELHSSPGPSSSEPTEFQQGSVPSLSNNTELQERLLPSPKVTEFPQSPTPSPSNLTELHLKPVPSPLTDMQQSSVPSPDQKVLQLSADQPLSDDTELQQNALQAPNITEFQESATPSPSSVTELHLIPVSSTLKPTKVPQSPVASPYTKDLHLSPERHPSNVTALHPSPVPFPNITEIQHCPTSPPLKITEPSPLSPSNTALHSNLVSSLNATELQQGPVLSPSNVNDIPCSQVSSPTNIAEILQCPTPSPSKISELGLSPVPSSSKPTEFQQNPLTSPTNVLQPHQRPGSPPSNITEGQQNPTPCLSNITELPNSPPPSPSNIQNLQQSPKPTLSNVTMSHQNPLPAASNVPNISSDVTELHQSSASSPCAPELHQNPATSPNITALDQSSPTSPYAPELHQNPATSPNITVLHQSSPTSPHAPELHQNPATSPNITELHQSTTASPCTPELHQNPATSPNITELHQSTTASPCAPELHQNPATSPNITELHQSTASPCAPELHQNPATSPNITELHQSTTASPCASELHQNPATSPNITELHQSTTASPCAPELLQNPATSPNITELHQNLTASPNITELHQSLTPSPYAPELHQNPATCPNITELHQSSTASPHAAELHQNPATSNITEIDQSSATSPYASELHQTPATSPNITELHQNSTASPYTPEVHQNPATSNVTELHQSSVTSPSHGTRLCQSPVPPPSVTVCPSLSKSTVLHHSPVPSPSNATITRPSPVSSPAIPTELQPSPLPSPSSELHDNPVLLPSKAAEQIHKFEEPQNIQEPVLQPPPPSPVELVSSHPSSFESADLPKCPTAPQLCPAQVEDPQVNHVPLERKERHSSSPIANLCSTPPPLPSVPLDVERDATRLTSTPLQLSPPSSLSIDSTREKLAKSPVWCNVLSERTPCRLEDADGAKPGHPARESPELERDSTSPACLESVVCNTATDVPAPSTLSTPQSEPSSPLGHLPSPASLVHQTVSVDLDSVPLVLSETGPVEDVPGDQSDSPDCMSHCSKPTQHRTGSSGASPAGSFQAPCESMTDTASVEHSPVRTCPSDQPGSPVMPTGSSCQPAASALSLDASDPPRLPLSGRSSPLCSTAFETKPSHSTGASPTYCRPVDASSDTQGLITIVMESSVFSSNQSSHSSSSSTPPEAAERCPRSPTGSTNSSPQVDTQATSPEENPLQLDSGPSVTLEPARKTKSPSYQPGGPAASKESPTFPRQSPVPLGPSNDRAASSSTQAHGDMPETGCARETQAREDWSQLFRHAQSTESPEQPETGTGSAVHTRLQSETGPSDAGSTSAVSSEAESTSSKPVTTDQETPLHLHQYLPDKSEGVPDQAENMPEEENVEQMQEEKREQQQEENLLQNQEQLRTLRCLPSGTEQAVSSNNLQKEDDDSNVFHVSLEVHPSSGEPAAASPLFSAPPSPSSPSPSASSPPWPDVSSAASPPLSVEPDCSSEWPREDFREMLEATNDAAPSRAGSSERDDAVAMRPRREEARESDSGGEAAGGPEPSFDSEVMTLISSLSPSASLSPRPLHTRSLRPPPRSLPPTDELSIRLRQSPFSTEASPETSPVRVPLTPPPLSPPSPSFSPPSRELPPLCKTSPSASAVIPLTRKISMGKPAISKRKFSPGRSRVRQGSWWSNTRPVSPHSSSQDSVGEGGQDSPKSRQADSPLWSMRVGRGSGFPGRRRSRGGGGAGGGRGGRGRARLKTQDFVSVSPAYGFVESVPPKEEEEENSMHNTVVMFSTSDVFTLQQDMCVVCGSFGRGAEGRLLACSQCGQCYHPYCVNVKVTRVILTKGWRCLECTVCEACGEATDPGRLLLCDDCDISYHTYCLDPPLHTVPKGAWKCKWCVWCVQCGSASPGPHCDWQSNYSHCGPCASLTCCPLCQRAYAHDDLILQCQQCDRWVHAVCEGLATEDEAEAAADEGFDCSLCRTHSRVPLGRPDNLDMAQILSRSREADTKTYSQDGVCLTELGLSQLQSLVEPLTSARRYRRYKPKLKLRIINQNSVSVLQTPPHPDAGHLECDLKSDSSPERGEHALDDDVSKDVTKRKRKPYRPGIGGFMVRQRGGKAGGAAVRGGGEQLSAQTPQADEDGAERTADKAKKRYRKKKTKLEEAFPSYLQEAFFGRDLLYRIRQVDQRMLSEAARISQSGAVDTGKLIKAKQERLSGPDIGSVIHDPLLTSEPTGSGGRGQKALHEEPLDAILNPELDKMVTDGALLSKLHKIPELEGKDVEDLFIAVLSPDSSQQHNQYTHPGAGSKTHTAGSGAFPRLALPNGLAGHAANPDKSDTVPGGPVCGGTPCPPQTNQAAAEGEHDAMSTAQRSMMKWEKEEALGEQATVAPVLYCNTNFPQLREHYPEWSTRVKQIAKLWRKASSQDRAPYVQRARDNRAAQRIHKVHMCGEPPKRAHPCPPPPQGPYDTGCPDAADSALRDPFRPRESEQEQEWRLRQGEVKDRWRAGKKRQENTDKDCPFQASVAGGGKEALSQQRDSFVGTSGRSLALECPETSEHRTAAAHVRSGASPTDETTTGDETSLGGPMALLPQLGDSEEKLRQDAETSALVQRQRLRQLILRQQQQKSALRQEKGLREAGPSPAIPASGVPTPQRWPIADAPPRDALGRPPPPYPGTPHLPGEQLRGLISANMAPFPLQRGMPLRFFPQDSFPRSDAGGGAPAVAPAQLRKPLPSELIVIRPLTAAGPHPHALSAAPQAFPVPCALPVQQHSFLGQPYIELRHRAPENRLRMPFSPAAEEAPPGTRLGETAAGQPVLLMVQLNQQDQRNLVHSAAPALAQGHDVALQGAEGIEEHLEGVESAVKDLEDVEVKDLVDLSLNLDPEDGKEDLDLGPNDLHLDDFLLSGKFDLIAYADPELNLEDKKDMFNEELDLGDSVGELKKVAPQKDSLVDSAVPVKEENEEGVQADPPNRSAPLPPPPHPQKIPGPDGAFGLAAAASGAEGKLGQSVCGSGLLQANVKAPPCALTPPLAPGPQSGFRQSVAGPSSAYLAPHPPPSRQTSAPQAPLGLPLGSGPHSLSLQLSQPCPLISPQAQPLQPPCSREEVSPLGQDLSQSNGKPLLLEEQPLLLQDLLDQERQEQQQQKQMQALIRHKSTPEPVIPDLADFDSVTDPIMKAKMVALKGINKVMSQGSLGLNNMVINRFHQAPAAATPEATSQPPAPVAQGANLNAQLARPNPPSFGPGFVNDSQRRRYEEWLGETQRLLQMQQRLLEEQLAAHRKTKKALSAKQRTAKKAGREPTEDDAAQLRYVVEQQAAVQKQLEEIRKQQKDHTVLIEDYRTSQRQQRAPPTSPPAVLPQNAAPLPSGVQKVPPTWSAPLMPPALPTVPQAPATVPGLPVPASGFASGDLSVPTPQVKFDDNNPFSEGFQERERRERLREQQERHRVQLMQGVERHRLLQQHRLDGDQQGGARLCPAGPAVATGSLGPAPAEDALSQIAFFSSELPQDFLQSPPGARPPAPGAQAAVPFPAPQQGFTGGLHPHGAGISPERVARVLPLEVAQTKARPAGSPAQVRPLGTPPTPPSQAAQGHHPFSPDSAFSSPSTALCAPFSSSSLSQLYADILPDDGPKRKKRSSVNRDSGAGTPLYTHSDNIADSADTSCSTPTRGGAEPTDSNFPPSALAPSLELERQLSVCSTARERGALTGADRPKGLLRGSRVEVKEEREERGDPVQSQCASPLHDPGKELLRHLLREKASPHQTPSPGTHGPLTISGENLRSEDEDGGAFHDNVSTYALISDVLDSSTSKKLCKRAAARPDKDKNLSKCKRRRREDEDALDCSSSPSERTVTHLTQLSALPLMEPVLVLDLSPFPPYGSSSLGRVSRLSGSFGNACLDGVADYYAQLACKNILGNPPTPPASLPPTPPPQKLLNGFATAEEVSRQDSERTASCDGPKCGGGAVGPDLAPSSAPVKSKGEALRRAARTADVDVPASLPTPPHNNQEELRIHDSSPCGSPDGFVPSSSPESTVDGEVSRYPDLSFVKTEALSPCPSPPIPIVPCSWGKGSALKREVKTEAGQQAPPSCSNADLVPIAITLNSTASQNVLRVMAAVAKLLRLPAPINYQLSRASLVPPALVAGVSVPLPQASASSMQQRTAPPTGARLDSIQHNVGGAPAVSIPPSCGFCKVLLGNGVRKIQEAKQEGGSSLLFCSPTCSALYSSGPKAAECAASLLPQHRYANNMSSFAVHSLPATPLTPSRTAAASPPPRFPSASAITMETKPRLDGLKVKVKLKPHPHAFSEADCQRAKRTKSLRWRRWNVNVALTSRGPVSDKAVAVPTEEEADVLLKKLGACLRPDPFPADQRRCCFCHQQGDGETDGAARLLNLDLDLWVHLNCALWSSEVYETQAGALINVELALRRGLTLRCAHCQQTGATSGCNRLRCTNTYHFTCAIRAHCTFFKDKTMLCQLHRPTLSGPPPEPCAWPRHPYDSELRCFAVFRRVYVQRDEARQVAAMVQRGEQRHSFRVGSLLFCAVGRLLPRQMSAFHDRAAIFPVGYHANRIYWSMRHSNRRCKYMCFIEEQEARPLFKVKVVENGYNDLVLTAPTPKGVWDQILEPVARLRSSSGMLKLFPDFLKGEDLFGLSASAVCRIIESLPGVEACERYTFRYGRNPLMEWPLAFNPSGSARSEPKASQAKRPYLLTSMAPRCQGSVGSIVGAVPGVISLSPGETVAGTHQGRHSKLAQYRRMKADWKTNVYLARSRIQGLGLYAARDIEKCTMVIEYIGAIIRSEVADRKERLYESQNRGVYMFRIDNDYVIDATITGGPARYINHSCAPNCVTEVVSVEKENKIIISSCRRIQRGEELSYDYKFDLEDDQHKIPCHCGAFNCRKWMN